jgi:hypothetical protein
MRIPKSLPSFAAKRPPRKRDITEALPLNFTGPEVRLIEAGARALKAAHEERQFFSWFIVGHATELLQAKVLQALKADRPTGAVYARAFGAWLKKTGLELPKGVRTALMEMMRHGPSVHQWWAGLPMSEKIKLSHPMPIIQRWRREAL